MGKYQSSRSRNKLKAKLIALYGPRCMACGTLSGELTIDHVLPLSMGGSKALDNLQLLCPRCNAEKANQHIDYRPKPG